ncbi:hypothetical protein XFF6166_490112 [Xanthomonas citri pv. fuscans]|nr:hypothetical protein XFF6166_490112 [Xanthomonas citri pv. fuscans]SOO00938.1 hypothetical protein XFF7767_1080070 [Xanthomonas citri pv. fuscans]SOO01289.1 hypothetical protein XFF6960_460112 [Xanthomonas citri pv. fuscans]SOO09889.1 hypothetical protein XFF6970_490024 [Xanthomonas citri pv. fuscans]
MKELRRPHMTRRILAGMWPAGVREALNKC